MLALIDENRRLAAAYDEACNASPETDEVREERAETSDALIAHWRNVVLKSVPTTAAGCAALARYAADFYDVQGPEIDEDPRPLLRLIAQSPRL